MAFVFSQVSEPRSLSFLFKSKARVALVASSGEFIVFNQEQFLQCKIRES